MAADGVNARRSVFPHDIGYGRKVFQSTPESKPLLAVFPIKESAVLAKRKKPENAAKTPGYFEYLDKFEQIFRSLCVDYAFV